MNALVQLTQAAQIELCADDFFDDIKAGFVHVIIEETYLKVAVMECAKRAFAFVDDCEASVYAAMFAVSSMATSEEEDDRLVMLTDEQVQEIEYLIFEQVSDEENQQEADQLGLLSDRRNRNYDTAYGMWLSDNNDPRVSRAYGGFSLHKDIWI